MKAAPHPGLFRGPYVAPSVPLGLHGFIPVDTPGVKVHNYARPYNVYTIQLPLTWFGEGATRLGDIAAADFGGVHRTPVHMEQTAALLGLLTRPLSDVPSACARGERGMPGTFAQQTVVAQPNVAVLLEALLGYPGETGSSSGGSSSGDAVARPQTVALRIWVLQMNPRLRLSELVGRQIADNERAENAKKRKRDDVVHGLCTPVGKGSKGGESSAKRVGRVGSSPAVDIPNPMTAKFRVHNTNQYVEALRGYACQGRLGVDELACGPLDHYVACLGASARQVPLLAAATAPGNGVDVQSHALGPEHTLRVARGNQCAMRVNLGGLNVPPGLRSVRSYIGPNNSLVFPRKGLVWVLAGDGDPMQTELPEKLQRVLRFMQACPRGCAGVVHPDERVGAGVKYEALPRV